MLPEILSLEKVNVSEAVGRCADSLLRGKLLVFPTETVYGLAAIASNANAVSRLCIEKERRQGHALPLAVSGFEMVREFVSDAPPLAERLARRFWPGPLTLVVDASESGGKWRSFSKDALKAIMPQNSCGFRAPQNDFLLNVIRRVGVPVVLTSANISGRPPATTVKEAIESLGDRVDLYVDGGPAAYGQPSTVAKIDENGITILREGAVSSKALKNASVKTIMFVCSANRGRSPMAEGITKVILGKELGVSPDKLEENGFRVISSGTDAYESLPATPPVIRVMEDDYGLSLKQHRSKRVTLEMLKDLDVVFTMEIAHRDLLHRLYPDGANRIITLSPDEKDIADPYGSSVKEHRKCARQLESLIKARLGMIL